MYVSICGGVYFVCLRGVTETRKVRHEGESVWGVGETKVSP